jgi:hypothetical protein
VIKRHDITAPRDLLKYRFRKSRARRAWATGKALTLMGIGTPVPLGWVEGQQTESGHTSYLITRLMPDAHSAREYIKPQLHKQSRETRIAVGQQILELLLELYEHGIYHADTKTSNMLVTHAEADDARAFHWIDLDSVRFGVTPTRALILRNLIQLNGSIGTKIDRADRMYFLERLAERFPWATDESVPQAIEEKTRMRLLREVRRECGH